MMDTNFGGLFNLSNAVIPHMVKQQKGVILAVSSMWGQTGASCEALYSASKGAVDSYIKAPAKELGPSGIRVNAVSPGAIDTDMMSCFSDEDKQVSATILPLGRLGKPEEIAEDALFPSVGEGFIYHGTDNRRKRRISDLILRQFELLSII